ncbi:MAG TPA: hypothetical protein VFR58_08515 [Flavisolibacter sp.]|nr:hypothetical protein [Flavisolibacter sp.]
MLVLLTGVLYYPKWRQQGTEATISWDVSGYYFYLPSIFIYRDIKQLRFKDKILQEYRPTPDFQQAFAHRSGNYVMKYSSGQALLLSPFFFAAHAFVKIFSGFPADGFSYPYQLAIGIGALFYALLGLVIIRKVLLFYFPDRAVALTLPALVFASNYLNYAAIDGAMTHNTLFTVYALLLYFTVRLYRDRQPIFAFAAGALAGLAMLVRPSEVIAIIIPLSWGVNGMAALKNRFAFFSSQKKNLFLFVTGLLLFALIQPVYWKAVAGEWLVYSYGNEGFDWLRPHFQKGMFSYRSGWLVYSPVMVLALLGFVPLFRYFRPVYWPVFIFFLLFAYICFSWQTWWYGGSLGQRAMVQSYPLLCFPLAALFGQVLRAQIWKKLPVFLFLVFCAWYNLWLTHQAHRGGLFKAGEMTGPYLRAIFGRWKVNDEVLSLLDHPVRFSSVPGENQLVYANNFDDASGNEEKSLVLDSLRQFSPEYFFTLPKGKGRLRATALFLAPQKEWDTWKMACFMVRFYRKDELLETALLRVHRLLQDGSARSIALDAHVPDGADRASTVFWNAGGSKKLVVDELRVIVF